MSLKTQSGACVVVEVCNYRDSHVCIRASEGKIWTESLRCFHL